LKILITGEPIWSAQEHMEPFQPAQFPTPYNNDLSDLLSSEEMMLRY